MTAAISISNLVFRWPKRPTPCLIIDQFTAEAREHVFLHGASGSGKSTLLNLIGCVLTPESGKLELLGKEVSAISSLAQDRFRVDHIGFIFQQFNLIPYLSVLDNVLLPCRFSARRAARATSDGRSLLVEAERLLAELDLEPQLGGQMAAELSVGQQQRVAAARALIGRPEIIMADEPTSALDAARQEAFVDLLIAEAVVAGSTLIFVSHDQRLARHFDRCVRIEDINCLSTKGEATCAP